MQSLYADVIVDITHEKLDKTFQYKVPEALREVLKVGMAVKIPFGKGNRRIQGYVIRLGTEPEFDVSRMKEILEIADSRMGLESKLIALAGWMREYYGSTMIQALKTVLPVKQKIKQKEKKQICLLLDEEEAEKKLAFYREKHQKARARLLEALIEEKELPVKLAVEKLNISASVIKALEEQNILSCSAEKVYRNPIQIEERETAFHTLNEEQQAVAQRITGAWEENQGKTYLLHGVTGSGKTEVYMELIAYALSKGQQAIVLIPEIALTYQTVMRFYRRFGDRISIINSRLSQGERYDQFERAREGEVDVIIGPRSALFTPFPKLGLIIIDEEHEDTYKSETTPRYHARETAIKRAQLEGARVVLGSATPSVEAYYRAEQGEYILCQLKKRVEERPLPQVWRVDLRKELEAGNRSILSGVLRNLIEDRLLKKQQIMLFLNRRGYAGFLSCRSCGHALTCPHCDVSLSLHRGGRMICHYCGHEEVRPSKCPECGSPFIREFKVGTQQVEEYVKSQFPEARILRMDMDTTREKDSHGKILSAFADHEADILIGTQMIVKGHDFPNVTLVGILAADMSLHASDFRAAERTFQLLTQAAGRAGRGEEAGQVVIQTYDPENYAILAAADQDYESFYQQEILYRKLAGYPPAAHMLAIHGSGPEEAHLALAMEYLKKLLDRMAGKNGAGVIGPAGEAVAKINDVYRKVIYVKHQQETALIRMKDKVEQYIEMNEGYRSVTIQFDMNGR